MNAFFGQKYKKQILQKSRAALAQASIDVKEDLAASGTLPFGEGKLQNTATYVDLRGINQNRAAVINDAAHARRLYFHPEFNFNQAVNKNAGGRWFDIYIGGVKRNFAKKMFIKSFKRRHG